MLKGYIDAYWVKNSNMKKSPNQNGKKFRGRWGNCWNMKKFPNCGWMCREGLGEYLEWQKNTQCRRKCYRNAVPFALRCASCSCRAVALYIQSENQHPEEKYFMEMKKSEYCRWLWEFGATETLKNIERKKQKSELSIHKLKKITKYALITWNNKRIIQL